MGAWSDREIARRCAVVNAFVPQMRHSPCTKHSVPTQRTYQDRHGNVTQVDTARIRPPQIAHLHRIRPISSPATSFSWATG